MRFSPDPPRRPCALYDLSVAFGYIRESLRVLAFPFLLQLEMIGILRPPAVTIDTTSVVSFINKCAKQIDR